MTKNSRSNARDLQLFDLSQNSGLQEVYKKMETLIGDDPLCFGPSLPATGLASLRQKLAFILYITEFGSQLNKTRTQTN